MVITLKVSEEKFTNEKGEEIEYFAYTAVLDGEEVRFIPRQNDKRLVEHYVKRALKAQEGGDTVSAGWGR